MAIDPELAAVVDLLPDMEALDLQARRDAVTAMVDAVQTVDADVEARVRIEDRRVPGPPGAPEVPVRIYTPTTGEGPYPLLMCFHGGAFMVGTMAMDHATGVDVADRLQAIAVAVEYRLAPENPYPAGVEDCYAATVWAADSGELDVDRSRVVVSGASAGGALAAAVALMARDRGGPSIAFQILNIPVLDDRMDTPSMRDHVATPMFHRPGAETMWDNYLGVDRGPAPAYARARTRRGSRGPAARLHPGRRARPAARRGHPVRAPAARGGRVGRAPRVPGHVPRLGARDDGGGEPPRRVGAGRRAAARPARLARGYVAGTTVSVA